MVRNPLFAFKIDSQMVLCCIAITWIYSSLISIPQLIYGNGFLLEGLLTTCSFDYLTKSKETKIILISMTLFGFVLPLVIIISSFMFLVISLKTNKNLKKLKFKYIKIERSNLGSFSSLSTNLLDELLLAKNEDRSFSIQIDSKSSLNSILLKDDAYFRKNVHKYRRHNHRRNAIKPTSLALNDCMLRRRNGLKVIETIESKHKYYFISRELNVAKNLVINICVFCLALTPCVIIKLYGQFSNSSKLFFIINPYTTSISIIFANITIISNPLIYTLTEKKCKKYFYNLTIKTLAQN